MNHFYSVIVKSDRCLTFEIEKEKLDIIFTYHSEVKDKFRNFVSKKLNAFLKRFFTVKSSLENLFESKNDYNCQLEKIEIKKMRMNKILNKYTAPINISFQKFVQTLR